MPDAFIYDHVRTPRGRGKTDGALHEVPAVQLSARTLEAVRERNGLDTAVLSGGVFQNRLLLADVGGRLRHAGLDVLSPRAFPANDGGIALGQAVIAAAAGRAKSS